MDVNAYLERIGYRGSLEPTAKTLRALQQAHLLSVPFENLDVYLKRPIVLHEDRLFAKIVGARRGGFCYELNGLFAALLRSLGYKVDLLAAEVANGSGSFGQPFDHLVLRVEIGYKGQGIGESRVEIHEQALFPSPNHQSSIPNMSYLVDVGFGDSFRAPLRLILDEVQHDNGRIYRIVQLGDALVLQQQDDSGAWQTQHRFTLTAHRFAEYNPMCQYHQSSPESHFTQRRICTLARPDGRITLSDLRLITTRNGVKEERLLDSEAEWRATLADQFGVVLNEPTREA